MRVIILSNSPETISEYLSNAGHEVKECLSTDVAERMVEIHNPDALLVFEDVPEVSPVTLRHVIKSLVPRVRVILIAKKTSPLVPYAAAFGVRDYVFLPADSAQILHRIENPALPEDAAEMLDGTEIRQQQQETLGLAKRPDSPEKGAKKKNRLLKRLFANKSTVHQDGVLDEDKNREPALIKGENKIGEEKSESTHQTDIKQSRFFAQKNQDNEDVVRSQEICYIPHQLIAVWSPSGSFKSFTALNLAALAAAKGFDVALVNFDILCPELDFWFGIKQTTLQDFDGGTDGLGVVTFGESLRPELALRLLKEYGWGIKYLPSGNKLGNIGTPNLTLEILESVLRCVYQRDTKGKPALTVVDAGRYYEYPPTYAAVRLATIVLVPLDGSLQTAEVAKQHIEELNRLGVNPRVIELVFAMPGVKRAPQICEEAVKWSDYLRDSATKRPQCLSVNGRGIWESVFRQVVTPKRKSYLFGRNIVAKPNIW